MDTFSVTRGNLPFLLQKEIGAGLATALAVTLVLFTAACLTG